MDKWDFFPYFVQPYELDPDEDLPEHAAILIEEAALLLYARKHGADLNQWISKILGACGQKGQIIVFLSHHTRKIDVNVILDMDLWALKQPSYWHAEFERREVKKIVKRAYEYFEDMLLEDARKQAYLFGGTSYDGVPISNPLPSFWCEELSKIWEGVSLIDDEDEPKSSNKNKGNDNTIADMVENLSEEQLQNLFAEKLEPRKTPLTKEEIKTAEMLLDRAKRTMKEGQLSEAFENVEKAYEILGEEHRPPILGSERGSLADEEEAAIISVMSRWTVMEEEDMLGPRSKLSWTPLPTPDEPLGATQEEELKEQAVYVNNGLEIHYKSDAEPRVKAVISTMLETTPDRYQLFPEESTLEGYDKVIYFDLRRRSQNQDFTAAGGRIIPTELIRDLNTVSVDDDITVGIDPVHARQIA